jgi:hypothetical protein
MSNSNDNKLIPEIILETQPLYLKVKYVNNTLNNSALFKNVDYGSLPLISY